MTFTFDYKSEEVFTKNITVEDIGNCALECTDVEMSKYYIATQTLMGETYLLKFGPIIPDLEEIGENFSLDYKKFDYKETTIVKEIDRFVNDGKRGIEEITPVELEDVLTAIPTYDKFIPANDKFIRAIT